VRVRRRGCLETVASTMALLRAAEDAIAGKQATRLQRVEGKLDVAALATAASEGDAVAKRILAQGSEHLGRGISFLLNILNPEMIVLGGPVIDAGEPFLHEVRASVARHALLPRAVAIVPSTLGESRRADRLGIAGHGKDCALVPNRR